MANVIGAKMPPLMEMTIGGDYGTGQVTEWIEKCNMNVLNAIQRSSTQLGRTRGQNGLLRDLCEGLEGSTTSVLEMVTASLERSGGGQTVWFAPKTVQS